MGAAPGNTTLTRRPVDFFFGEDVPVPGASEQEQSDLVPVPVRSLQSSTCAIFTPNCKQPRTDFDEQDMEDSSIRCVRLVSCSPSWCVPPASAGREVRAGHG